MPDKPPSDEVRARFHYLLDKELPHMETATLQEISKVTRKISKRLKIKNAEKTKVKVKIQCRVVNGVKVWGPVIIIEF